MARSAACASGMRSWTASFYDPYLWQAPRRRSRISLVVVALVIAVLVLLALIAADVAAYEAIPPKVTVTAVTWYVEGFLLGNESGFTVVGGHSFEQKLVCEIFCANFDRASVNPPFSLSRASYAYPWFEYVNLTVVAPGAAYDGPLNITLGVGPAA